MRKLLFVSVLAAFVALMAVGVGTVTAEPMDAPAMVSASDYGLTAEDTATDAPEPPGDAGPVSDEETAAEPDAPPVGDAVDSVDCTRCAVLEAERDAWSVEADLFCLAFDIANERLAAAGLESVVLDRDAQTIDGQPVDTIE